MIRRSMNTVLEESNEGALNNTASSSDVLEREAGTAKQNKRYLIFCELLDTEQNYVDVLRCILKDYKYEFDKLKEEERDQIINKHERQILFSKIESLLSLHEVILSHFKNENNAWTGKNMIAYVFAQQKDKMLKNYVPYINSYDEMADIVKRVQTDPNPVVQHFLKECEARSDKRFTIKDLLIRPVQRLPSVVLLLKQLLKYTPKSNPDHPCIQLALQEIDGVLSKSNENRRDTDNYQHTLQAINSIEHFPPEHIQSNRALYAQADFQLIHANGAYRKYKGSVLTFFLFDDFVVVAKRRDRVQPIYQPNKSRLSLSQSLNTSMADLSRTLTRTGSMSTLKRSLSFISQAARPERKPFKYQETLYFLSFRQCLYIRQEGLFFLKLRDEMSDEMATFRVTGETTIDIAEELICKLCDLVNCNSKRELQLIEVSNAINNQTFDTTLHPDELEYVRKIRKNLMREHVGPVFRFGGRIFMSTLKDEEFQRSITSLNRDFLAFITKHLEISPNVDLTPSIKSYMANLEKLDLKYSSDGKENYNPDIRSVTNGVSNKRKHD